MAELMLFLADKSAHELARRDEKAGRAFETLAVTGLLATCAMVQLEILYSARNRAEHKILRAYLREHCVWLETTDAVLLHAVDLQEDLFDRGMGRKPLPDLVIAAVAIHHDAVLVHNDRDFVDIAGVAPGLRQRWIVPPG